MTNASSTRSVGATEALTDLLADASWELKLSRGAIVRNAIAELLKDPSQVTQWGPDPGNGPKRITFIIDDDDWETLRTEAWTHRARQAAATRIAIVHYIATQRAGQADG